MKIKPGFTLRTVMGEAVVVGEGLQQINFNKLVSLNSTAAVLWKAVEGKDFTADDLADVLVKEYGIDRATALADSADIAQKWVEAGLMEA